MADAPYYLTFIVTLICCGCLFWFCRRRQRRTPTDPSSAATIFTIGSPVLGFLSGAASLPAFTSAFISLGWLAPTALYGHGEVLIAAPLFNAALGAALGAAGRIFLPWRPIKW